MPTPTPLYRIVYQDGPCAFSNPEITAADVARGTITCNGTLYRIQVAPGGAQNGYVGYQASTTTDGNIAHYTPDIFAGYHDLQGAFVNTLRPALDRARRNDLATLRLLSRRHRVKGR